MKQYHASLLAAIVFLVAALTPVQSAIIRVKTGGNDSNNGSTWDLAKATIQAGINAAASGDEVWVAAGTYVQTITLKTGVKLYGGFAGLTSSDALRDSKTYISTVDGNKLGSVMTVPISATNVVIDGFTIRNGSGQTDSDHTQKCGGGIRCLRYSSASVTNNIITDNSTAYGGGIFCFGATVVITDNVVSDNFGRYGGGGLFLDEECVASIERNSILDNVTHSDGGGVGILGGTATISDNTISGNKAWSYGGGVLLDANCLISIIENNIDHNQATNFGGGISFRDMASASPVISLNTIVANSSNGDGGGLFFQQAASPVISGNSILDNSCYGAGGGIMCTASALTLVNNTVARNAGKTGGGIECNLSSGVVANNIIACNSSGVMIPVNPAVVFRSNCTWGNGSLDYSGMADPTGADGNISADPVFANLVMGNFHVQPGSPCLDTGWDDAPSLPTTDTDAQTRTQGTHVDMGSDESDTTVWSEQPVVVRVSPNGSDDAAHDGSSWALAKRTVQAGVDAASLAGGEMWVAAATYAERVTLAENVYVYGGFAGKESVREERNWALNKTILDGGGSGNVISVMNCPGHQVNALDGFTVRNAGASYRGIYCAFSSPSITNNTITGNGYGIECVARSLPIIAKNTISANPKYGVFCSDSSPLITKNMISGSALSDLTVLTQGSGICCSYHSAPLISNNYIAANCKAGIYCDASDTLTSIVNNTISGNGTCGIYCISSNLSVTNNTVAGNVYGIIVDSYSPLIANNIVAFNSTGIYKGGATSVPVLENNCVYNPGGTNYSYLPAGAGDISLDPKFVSAAYGLLHIQPDSPCVDAGLDGAVQPGWTDMDGQSRILGTHADIGADESAGTMWPEYQPVVVRVSTTGSDEAAHDGSTWALAKRTVQAAIDAASVAGGDVWVAAGTYAEQVSLQPYAYVYGGFSGLESARDQRNWLVNKSILSMSNVGSVVLTKAGHRVSRLDGFTVTSGSYGIYSMASSPWITNDTVSGNDTGIYCGSLFALPSSASITNSVISGNGTGITSENSSPVLANNTISGNDTYGIYSRSSKELIANNTISGTGVGVYSYNSSPSVTNNLIAFSASGIKKNGTGSPVLTSNCVYCPAGTNYIGLSPGAGDFSLDPLLVSQATGDYHLQVISPCINAGLNSTVQPDWLDMDGEPRILPLGGRVDIGADEFGVLPVYSPSEAKLFASDGQEVFLRERGPLAAIVTTARFDDLGAFYVEEKSRAAGVQCRGSNLLSLGHSAVLRGTLATIEGELVLANASAVAGSVSTAPIPDTLAMNNKTLGGESFGLQGGVWNWGWISNQDGSWSKTWLAAQGLNNLGLFVRVWGKVTQIDPSGQYFYMDDGSGVRDGTKTGDNDNIGVRIAFDGRSFTSGDAKTVTGISSCFKNPDGDLLRLVRVRQADDIQPM